MPKRTTKRMQYRFWLDVLREDEKSLADYVQVLTESRQFAPTIRQALTLIQDLKQGNSVVLFQFFPWLRDQLRAELRTELMAELPPNSTANQLQPTLQAHLEQIKNLLEKQSAHIAPPSDVPLPSMVRSSQADVPQFDLEITASTGSDENPTYNLLISTLAIGNSMEYLPLEVIEYGIRKGRLPSNALQALQKQPQGLSVGLGAPSAYQGGPKPLAGATRELSPPLEDSDDLDNLFKIREKG